MMVCFFDNSTICSYVLKTHAKPNHPDRQCRTTGLSNVDVNLTHFNKANLHILTLEPYPASRSMYVKQEKNQINK